MLNIKNDELLDLVDNQDNVIAQEFRSKLLSNVKNVRVVNAFLTNDNNQIWIPKRTMHKKIFPSCLDFSVGGFVISGETYQEAFKREVHEELNLNISALNYSFLFKLSPYEHNVSSFMHIYQIKMNTTPNYNTNDFESYSWMTIHELKIAMQNKIPMKNDLIPTLLYFELFLNSKSKQNF